MSDSLTSSLTRALSVAFDAGQLTSDGGLVWLARADDRLGLSAALAAQIREWRRGPVRHPLALLLRQRLLHIACGDEDQDDADTWRHDPLLKLVCGRHPHAPSADLASQPTLSRLENAVDRRACYRLAQALLSIYLQERERAARGIPTHVLLDLDSTADPTHGAQEGSSYHGSYGYYRYHRQHRYHPLLVFDGDTNQLITAVLRQGTVHASRGVVAILRRLVSAIRARWPLVSIELRADSGFAIPALYEYCEMSTASASASTTPLAWRPMPAWKRSPLPASGKPSSTTSRPVRKCAWPARGSTRRILGPTSGASSTKPRSWRKAATCASS
jgi:Transposase DDE domain group 1